MNKTAFARTASLALGWALAACSGGGGTPTSPAMSAPAGAPTSAPSPAPTDPYTGQAAPGMATTSISGTVYGTPVSGATVAVYAVQNDGGNGELLGTSSVTAADGSFAVQLTKTPTGMVRLVATGGSYTSEADGTTQPVSTLELVAPYVTSDLNHFVITPVTNIASHVLAYKAKNGSDLNTAYTAGASFAMELSWPDTILRGDLRNGIDYLTILPGSADDTLNAYQDLLTSLEWFGVRYDLPSRVVFRIAAQSAEGDYPFNGVDGSHTPINVGNWVGNTFDDAAARTMDQMMYTQTLNGTEVHDHFEALIQVDYLFYFYRNAACLSDTAKPAFYARFPAQSTFFTDPQFNWPSACTFSENEIADLKARIATNRRTEYMR